MWRQGLFCMFVVVFIFDISWLSKYNHVNKVPLPTERATLDSILDFRDVHAGARCFVLNEGPGLSNELANDRISSLFKNEIVFGENSGIVSGRAGVSLTYHTVLNSAAVPKINISKVKNTEIFFASDDVKRDLKEAGLKHNKYVSISVLAKEKEVNDIFCTDIARCHSFFFGATFFVNLQLAFHMGCARVILVGYIHFFKESQYKPGISLLPMNRWLSLANEKFRAAGKIVIDATTDSRCTVFRKSTLMEELSKPRSLVVKEGVDEGRETSALPNFFGQGEENLITNQAIVDGGGGKFCGSCPGVVNLLGTKKGVQKTCVPHIWPKTCIIYSYSDNINDLSWELELLDMRPNCQIFVTGPEFSSVLALPAQTNIDFLQLPCASRNGCRHPFIVYGSVALFLGHKQITMFRVSSSSSGATAPEELSQAYSPLLQEYEEFLRSSVLQMLWSGKPPFFLNWTSTCGAHSDSSAQKWSLMVTIDKKPNLHLVVSWLCDAHKIRQRELFVTLGRNLNNSAISQIHMFLPEGCAIPVVHSKLFIIDVNRRLNYTDFFAYANTHLVGKTVAVSHADIWFSEMFLGLDDSMLRDSTVFSLSRLEDPNCEGSFGFTMYHHHGIMCGPNYVSSHDAFVFRSPVPISLPNVNFMPNQPGSEMVVMYELEKSGSRIFNPCVSFPVYHMDCNRQLRRNRIESKYKTVPLHFISEGTYPDGRAGPVRYRTCKPGHIVSAPTGAAAPMATYDGLRDCSDALRTVDGTTANHPQCQIMYFGDLSNAYVELFALSKKLGCKLNIFDPYPSAIRVVKSAPFQKEWTPNTEVYLNYLDITLVDILLVESSSIFQNFAQFFQESKASIDSVVNYVAVNSLKNGSICSHDWFSIQHIKD